MINKGYTLKIVIEVRKSELIKVTEKGEEKFMYNKIFIEKPTAKEIQYLGL